MAADYFIFSFLWPHLDLSKERISCITYHISPCGHRYEALIWWSLEESNHLIIFMGFPDNSVSKESACNVGDLGSSLGLGRSPGEEKGYPLQYSGLENSMDCIVSPWGRKESDTTVQLSIISILTRHGIWLLLTKKDTRLPWWFSW